MSDDRTIPVSDGGVAKSSPSKVDLLLMVVLFIYTLLFVFFRIAEIAVCSMNYGTQSISVLIGTLVLHCYLPRRARFVLHVLSLVAIVYFCDYLLPTPPPTPGATYSNKTIVVTGANAGIGLETSRRLALEYGMHVLLGCRSKVKCDEAANSINKELTTNPTGGGGSVTPMLIDLSNLDSVKAFASNLAGKRHVDVLLNNAGFAGPKGDPVNAHHGLEPSFSSMHLGHFYLTELMLMQNPSLRVVLTSSGTHHACAFSMVVGSSGCLHEEFYENGIHSPSDEYAYIRAKLANVLHAIEIPKRHPMATAIVIDQGWVGTLIKPFMTGALLTPSNLGMMRSARIGVSPILTAILSSTEELSVEIGRELNDAGASMNVFGQLSEALSAPWWKTKDEHDVVDHSMSERLWDESVRLLFLHGHVLISDNDVVADDLIPVEEAPLVDAHTESVFADDPAPVDSIADDHTPVDETPLVDAHTEPVIPDDGGMYVEDPVPVDETPLIDAHIAAMSGDLKALVAIATKDDTLLNIADRNGWTPLHEAARWGHLEAVKFLISKGLEMDKRTNWGSGASPLWWARNNNGDEHPVVHYLQNIGAVEIAPE